MATFKPSAEPGRIQSPYPLLINVRRSSSFFDTENSAMVKNGMKYLQVTKLFLSLLVSKWIVLSSKIKAIVDGIKRLVLNFDAKIICDKKCSHYGHHEVQKFTSTVYFVCYRVSSNIRQVDASQPSCLCLKFDQ